MPTPRHDSDLELALTKTTPTPGLQLASAPSGSFAVDRWALGPEGVSIGRGPQAGWPVRDQNLSKQHARFWREGNQLWAADLGSTNGTFLRGEPLGSVGRPLAHGDVVRCGHCLLVASADVRPLLKNLDAAARFGWVGPFHAGLVLTRLYEAATIGRHVLLVGESGAGKELAARALAELLAERGVIRGGFLAHNCARMTSPEEATSTLFGVASRTFSEVSARQGLLEQAHGGALFLDELHVLPSRVQRSLLRFLEDGLCQRIGEERSQRLDVLLIASTNLPLTEVEAKGLVAFDLLNRLHVVTVPSLNERRADIPALFRHYARAAARRCNLDPAAVEQGIRTGHLEALCTLDYRDKNVREVIRLAERLAARVMVERASPRTVLSRLLAEGYPENPVVQRLLQRPPEEGPSGASHYERHREQILTTYRGCDENLSETQRRLLSQGLQTSRRWLSHYLKLWGAR